MVFLLLDSIAAERDSMWELHLQCFNQMLDYDRAYDHLKYFKLGIVYLMDMQRLPEAHPDLFQQFKGGNHAVARSKTQSVFNCVATDMALEQSMNRDSKTKGGIIGVTQDSDKVEKWALTAHLRSAVHANFKELCEYSDVLHHKEMSRRHTDETEKFVIKIVNAFNNHKNPFAVDKDSGEPLHNIVSGLVVPDDHKNDVLFAKNIGLQGMKQYIEKVFVQKSK